MVEKTGHPVFAALYDRMMAANERRVFSRLRPWVLEGISGDVLEIGAGTGAGLPHYPRGARLVAAEPDPYMLQQARERARALGRPVEFHPAGAEELPFPDGSFDSVVGTLVLCTIPDPAQALGEVRRVLRPGGAYRFIEHVRHEDWRGALEDGLTPIWRVVSAGCHLNRRSGEAIRGAGFKAVRSREDSMPPGIRLVSGVACKS
ncbi:MAG: class I SAM-dependent methyltransferase [Euryarchaeota archaeon]|nr:class I SAM-dependent methyltransferase [Euryarchaeota archaeon]